MSISKERRAELKEAANKEIGNGDGFRAILAHPIQLRALLDMADELDALKYEQDKHEKVQNEPHMPTVAAALREVREAWLGSDDSPSAHYERTFSCVLRRRADAIEEGREDG